MICPYVYKLTHKETGEFYIGYRKANKVLASLDLGRYYFTSSKIILEKGFHNFNYEIIVEFISSDKQIAGDDAYDTEQVLVYDSRNDPLCLNGHYFKPGSKRFILRRHSDESKYKTRLSNLGRKVSMETRVKLSESHKGKIHSDAQKLKISQSSLGRKVTSETRRKIGLGNSGKVRTQETILKLSNSHLGNKPSEITKDRMSKSKIRKLYEIISPNGEKFYGENLNKFCLEHNINKGNMSQVCRGINKSCNGGWTDKYITT